MGRVAPLLRRHQRGKIGLDLAWSRAEREAQAMRDPKDVRIDGQRFFLREFDAERLSDIAEEMHLLVMFVRDFALRRTRFF